MKQFAIIGLSRFGQRILEELIDVNCEILIIDKSREIIEIYKDKVASAYVADAINEEIINKLVPQTIDAAVVDLGDKLEVSILVTNYLKKMGIKRIIAKAETDEHAEILRLVGATQIIFPNREAAKRIAPLLISSLLFSYLPISRELVIAEIKVPEELIGKTLIEANLRQKHRLNVVAFRKENESDYSYFAPDYRLEDDDIFLVAAKETDIESYTGTEVAEGGKQKISNLFKRFFTRFKEGEKGGNNNS
ncbi:MAG: TrkA family potassium uptake protein [Spirochaetales bacterium]|nr:TrkA family potassium uptake protein [Spirochaetales bacterium]